jgi:hypothetical protein
VCTNGFCAPPVHALYASGDTAASSKIPQPQFRIVNDSKTAIAPHDLTVRYYYSREPDETEQYACYWFTLGDVSLTSGAFGDVTPATATADRYLEVSFAASTPSIGTNQSLEVHAAFHVPSYSLLTQTNDYSYVPSSTFATSQLLTVYRNGILIWGTEP